MKGILISYFILQIGLEVSYAISVGHIGNSANRIMVIIALITILLFKNKYTWILGLCFFLYGLYNIMFIGTFTATPTAMEFTGALNTIFKSRINSLPYKIIQYFPSLFYFFALLAFATPGIREQYGFSRFKGKSQTSYLK